MTEQADRVYMRKRIRLGAGGFVDIPVVYQAKFRTAAEQYQDRYMYFDNSSRSSRKTHTHKVFPVSEASAGGFDPDTGTDFVLVERIDSFRVKTVQEQAQESEFILSNRDPAPIQPNGSDTPSHQNKHYVRYYQFNTPGGPYVDCELIDQLNIVCGTEQYQEYHLHVLHPTLGDPIDDATVPYKVTLGFCDPDLPLAPDESLNGLDPPYRYDPLQNIINISPAASSPATFAWPFVFNGTRSSGDDPFWYPATWEYIVSLYPQYSDYRNDDGHPLPQPSDTDWQPWTFISWSRNASLFNLHHIDGTPAYSPSNLFDDYNSTFNYFPGQVGVRAGDFGGAFIALDTLVDHAATAAHPDTDIPGWVPTVWDNDFGDEWTIIKRSQEVVLLGPPYGDNTNTPDASVIWMYGIYTEQPSGPYVPPDLPDGAGHS